MILAATGNKGIIKVPLSCLVEYKGILIFCRAKLENNRPAVPGTPNMPEPCNDNNAILEIEEIPLTGFLFLSALLLMREPL